MTRQALDHAHRPPNAGTADAATTGQVQVRHLRTHDEFAACVELQHAVWGEEFSERVPAALLKVAQRIGGIAAGAFTPDGRIVGFVFGLTGIENGEIVHWSDMLAVHADFRDHGIGRHLKEFQRATLAPLGVSRIYWTFDPLVARNAHLNLNRLGARVVEYVPDMYGAETSSALHRGVGTDRFVVAWTINGTAAPAHPPAASDRTAHLPSTVRTAPILNPLDAAGHPTAPPLPDTPAGGPFRVAIPLAIDAVQERSLALAADWRATTRRALTWGLAHGLGVRAFYRDDAAGVAYYVLAASPLAGES